MSETIYNLQKKQDDLYNNIVKIDNSPIYLTGNTEEIEELNQKKDMYKRMLDDIDTQINAQLTNMHSLYDKVVAHIHQLVEPFGLIAEDTTTDPVATSHYIDVSDKDDYLFTIRLSDHEQPPFGGYNDEIDGRYGDSEINIIIPPDRYNTYKLQEDWLLNEIDRVLNEEE